MHLVLGAASTQLITYSLLQNQVLPYQKNDFQENETLSYLHSDSLQKDISKRFHVPRIILIEIHNIMARDKAHILQGAFYSLLGQGSPV